jgi:hypothetical protein
VTPGRSAAWPGRAAGARCLAWLLLAAVVLLMPRTLSAQVSAPRMRAAAHPSEVEVGAYFTVQLIALVRSGERPPTNPRLRLPAGLALRGGPQIASRSEATLGAQPVVHTGIEATWRVEATRTGRFKIPSPSVEHGGRTYETNPMEVTVGPRGSRPPAPRSMDPFGLFPQLPFPHLQDFDDLLNPPAPPEPPSDPALALNAAPDASVFLRAMTDKTHAVVGEQVTLSIYQYSRTGAPDAVDVHEPNAPGFFQRQLLQPGSEQETRVAYVGGNPWRTELLRRIALFPLRTGRLEIGPMRASFAGFGLSRARGAAARQSNPLMVFVSDAPAEGRPVGFRPGDVGRFSLQASVEPRSIEAEGAVGVTVQLTGTGNLPITLPVPARAGVEWLEPEVREKLDVQNDRVAGSRTFRYVVRIHTPGRVNLGELALPYYDPDRKSYAVAQASLGQVMVTPSAAPTQHGSTDRDPFAAAGAVRPSLGTHEPSSTPLSDRMLFWLLLGGGPLTVLLLGGGSSALQKLGTRLRQSRTSPARQVSRALGEAREHSKAGDAASAASAAERAVHAALEASTGLRSRGVLRQQLPAALKDRGLDEQTANAVAELLERSEALRFEPGAEREAARELVAATEALTTRVMKKRVKVQG